MWSLGPQKLGFLAMVEGLLVTAQCGRNGDGERPGRYLPVRYYVLYSVNWFSKACYATVLNLSSHTFEASDCSERTSSSDCPQKV